MVYTVTFNPAIDYLVRMNRLCEGEVNRAESEELFFGGKGINVSAVLHELGVESVALGFTAGFTGKALEDGVRGMGIRSDFIRLPEGNTRINVKIKAEKETDVNAAGPKIDDASLKKLFAKLDALTAGDLLCLSGSIPKSLPKDIYEQILARLADRGILFVVDATGELLLRVLPYRPFLVKPNHVELAEMLGRPMKNDEELRRGAEDLQKAGARNVLVSMAGDGSMLLTERGDYFRLPAFRGTVKNSVGAGDSMVAGFLAGYLQTGDYEQALRLGSAAGSATAFSDGLCTKADVEALLNR